MRSTIPLVLFVILLASVSNVAHALDVSIPLPSPIGPDDKVVGIIMSPRGVFEKHGVKTQTDSLGRSVAIFTVAEKEVASDTTASAFVQTADGKIMFGHVVPAVAGRALTLPTCANPKLPSVAVTNQSGVLLSLIDNRANQISIQKEKLTAALNEDEIKRLTGLEKAFGLSQEKPLSPEMSPYELIDRLSRLLVAVRPALSLRPPEEE